MALATLDWMTKDAERLAQCNHDHPQAVLGPQPLDNGRWVAVSYTHLTLPTILPV